MNKLVKTSLLSLYFVLVPSFAEAAKAGTSTSQNSPPTIQSRPLSSGCKFEIPRSKLLKICTETVKAHFEPSNLSRNCTVVLQAKLSGVPTSTVKFNSGTKEDLFYCEQAIWDSAPFIFPITNAQGDIRFNVDEKKGCSSASCRSLFFKRSPDLKGKVVVIHLIPPRFSEFYPECVSAGELHDLDNLCGIRVDQLKNKLLAEFRQDWASFVIETRTKAMTPEDIHSQAQKLEAKYHTLFSS